MAGRGYHPIERNHSWCDSRRFDFCDPFHHGDQDHFTKDRVVSCSKVGHPSGWPSLFQFRRVNTGSSGHRRKESGEMRKIDGKFRIENEKIIHPSGAEVPEDEPLFLLRARDQFSLEVLKSYLKICKAHKCTSYHIKGIIRTMDEFGKFKREHPERIKQPGITEGK